MEGNDVRMVKATYNAATLAGAVADHPSGAYLYAGYKASARAPRGFAIGEPIVFTYRSSSSTYVMGWGRIVAPVTSKPFPEDYNGRVFVASAAEMIAQPDQWFAFSFGAAAQNGVVQPADVAKIAAKFGLLRMQGQIITNDNTPITKFVL